MSWAFVLAFVILSPVVSYSDEFEKHIQSFVQELCIDCHDSSTETRLDFSVLDRNLSNADVFRKWVHVFDRIKSGDMPPQQAIQPSSDARSNVLSTLGSELKRVNLRSQNRVGRVPSRRLSRSEYEHTLHDLMGIAGPLAKYLPPENQSESFDVVAAKQEMSGIHIRGFLNAAEHALDEAIQLGKKPFVGRKELNYFKSPYIQMWVDRPVRRGGGTVFKTDQDVVTFRGENYVFRSDANGFRPPLAGLYRIRVKAAAHQARSSITLSLKRQNDRQGESELFAAWDLAGDGYRDVSTTIFLRPDDCFYVSADELDPALDGKVIYNSQPASKYKGEGVKIRHVSIEGPLESSWPPKRTQDLFHGVKWELIPRRKRGSRSYTPQLTQSPIKQIRVIVEQFACQALGRKVTEKEIDDLVALAKPGLEKGLGFVASVRIPLRAILVSPELLFQSGAAGVLGDHAIARRLSYFLWRSLPDKDLTQLAAESRLSDPKLLAAQVDRMLLDPKSNRFVNEFLGQWLELDRIDVTTPDAYLYPEYDDVLRRAMLAETREFFAYMIREDLSVDQLIDSDFTFLNRRLAEHYGIKGVVGEEMRRVMLNSDSVRGGILTHASVAKITANGTVTSPVKRGNYVLSNLLGLPPNPPPPNVGSIEPDTRGATTIRETLQKHQSVEACSSCHSQIDPPGFAMECFDPVGSFRTRYRNSKGVKREINVGLRFLHKDYALGRSVDTSGKTADGHEFRDIREFKKQLGKSTEQVARNVVSKFIEFSTGGEIEFADRDEIERILNETRGDGFPLRSLIQHVVSSRLFRNR
ncbi:DUF1592 domain-containing protein [bacterium]|nr:DUF1592 domain-containing protein [bacterium]